MEEPQVNGSAVNGFEAHSVTSSVELNGVKPTEAVTNGKAEKFVMPTAKLAELKVTDYMRECLDKVASSEGFKNYDIDVVHGSAVGDGFVGIMFKATIKEVDSAKSLQLAVKSPPENVARRNQFGAMELFEREIHMYNVVLPEYVKFQEEKKIKKVDGFFEFPKCYFAELNKEKDDAIIIMEDLKEIGYKMWNKLVPTNFEHAKLIVQALGRLHAISFAMKAQKPELFESYKKLNDLLTVKFVDETFVQLMATSIDRAADTLDENDVKRKSRMMNLKNNFSQMVRDVVNLEYAEPYAIVTHGDCWSNNFMYQYKRGFPTKIVLLDWQVSRYCSPVLDLVYFFFVCTDGPMRKKHYDELLNLYHRSLKDLLDHLGGDTMSQFPFTALLRQLKQNGKFGLMMAILLVPMLTTKNEDLPDMDFLAENMDNMDPEVREEMMKSFGQKNVGYDARMRDLIHDAVRFGYL